MFIHTMNFSCLACLRVVDFSVPSYHQLVAGKSGQACLASLRGILQTEIEVSGLVHFLLEPLGRTRV